MSTGLRLVRNPSKSMICLEIVLLTSYPADQLACDQLREVFSSTSDYVTDHEDPKFGDE